jgi:hypothetical protein
MNQVLDKSPIKETRPFEIVANDMDNALCGLSEEVEKVYRAFQPVLRVEVEGLQSKAKEGVSALPMSPYAEAMQRYIEKINFLTKRMNKLCELSEV